MNMMIFIYLKNKEHIMGFGKVIKWMDMENFCGKKEKIFRNL